MGNNKIKIIVVDDHKAFVNAIKVFLRKRTDVEIVGEAYNADNFYEIMKTTIVDLVLLDINLPGTDGLIAGEKALTMDRNLNVLGVTMSDDYNIHFKMLQIGFSGGILKNQFTTDFDKALNKIVNREVYFPVLNR